MENHLLVSIIIPCYNSAGFLSRAVNSALAQSYANTEIILVDNNSSDDTYSQLLCYKSTFPQKIRVFQEKKQGPAAARNKGLKEAKGEWIQFLDSDDEILVDKIFNQLASVLPGKAGLVVGNYIIWEKNLTKM